MASLIGVQAGFFTRGDVFRWFDLPFQVLDPD